MARKEVRVNGKLLPNQAIAEEAQHHPARTPAAAFEAAARALVIKHLLVEEAARLGIEAEPQLLAPGKRETEEEALIRALMDSRVPAEADGATLGDRHWRHAAARFVGELVANARIEGIDMMPASE